MKEQIIKLEAQDGLNIFVRKWQSEAVSPKAVLQIVHGMAEHSERYREFGEYLTSKGYIIYINDHRGHGQTAKNSDSLGFFAKKNGYKLIIDDVHRIAKLIKKEQPDLKHFILGHSMGSFITRNIIARYDNLVDGAIISGTNFQKGFLLNFAIFMAKMQGLFNGKLKPSVFMTKMAFKDYNKPFKPTKTAFDWLSRDYERNKNYRDDPFCGNVMSSSFFVDIFTLIKNANSKKNMKKVNKNLPIFILSGSMDPVGNFGKDIVVAYNEYKNIGIKDITMKLYENGRHEMLSETNRTEVYEDIFNWLNRI